MPFRYVGHEIPEFLAKSQLVGILGIVIPIFFEGIRIWKVVITYSNYLQYYFGLTVLLQIIISFVIAQKHWEGIVWQFHKTAEIIINLV